MNLIYCEDYAELSRKAASVVASQLILNPSSVLGLATGNTPIGCYAQLVEAVLNGDISFSEARTFNLDEYVGASREDEQSFGHFMDTHLFSKVDLNPENINLLDGRAKDIGQECLRYDEKLGFVQCGIDCQILGVGRNGHIGFNEPDDHFPLNTHIVDLEEGTIEAQRAYYAPGAVIPTQGITMGMRPIMGAKQVILLASGESKAAILEEALFGLVKPEIPASILRFHGNLTVIADRAALSVIIEKHPSVVL